MTAVMRAKLLVTAVVEQTGITEAQATTKTGEQVTFCAVGSGAPYEADGSGDEDSTFSRWTPSASLTMFIQNPELFGTLKPGDKFYVDFSPAE